MLDDEHWEFSEGKRAVHSQSLKLAQIFQKAIFCLIFK